MISLKSTTDWRRRHVHSCRAVDPVWLTILQHGVRQLVPDPPENHEVCLISSKVAVDMPARRVFLTYTPVRGNRSKTELVVTHLQKNFQPVYGA